MILGVPLYGLLLWLRPDVAFLNHMAFTFTVLVIVMAAITWLRPLAEPVRFETKSSIDLTPSPGAKWFGAAVVAVTVALYVVFW